MSMRNERRDPIDALIDSAARQIVAGEPSSSLRSAVRDRVAARRPVWSLAPAWGVALGVILAALIVGRVLLSDPVGRTLSGPAGERDNVRPTIELSSSPDAPDKARPTIDVDEVGIRSIRLPWPAEARDERRRQANRNPVRLRRLAEDVAAPPQEEEPLIPPIAVEPLQPVQIAVGNPITVESSGVMPIEVAPLQLEPLRGNE
jgi:hypothetical protein